jgi:hypothetical protein
MLRDLLVGRDVVARIVGPVRKCRQRPFQPSSSSGGTEASRDGMTFPKFSKSSYSPMAWSPRTYKGDCFHITMLHEGHFRPMGHTESESRLGSLRLQQSLNKHLLIFPWLGRTHTLLMLRQQLWSGYGNASCWQWNGRVWGERDSNPIVSISSNLPIH